MCIRDSSSIFSDVTFAKSLWVFEATTSVELVIFTRIIENKTLEIIYATFGARFLYASRSADLFSQLLRSGMLRKLAAARKGT